MTERSRPVSEMEDEKCRREFRQWIRRERKSSEDKFGEEINDELEETERAFENAALADTRRKFWREEVTRLARHLREAELKVVHEESQYDVWTLTFNKRLERQYGEALTQLNHLQQQAGAPPAPAPDGDVSEMVAALDFAVAEMHELREKIARLGRLSKRGGFTRVIDHAGETAPDRRPAPKYLARFICSAPGCGRAKIDNIHPLCRNCQLLYAEGKLVGDWAQVSLAAPESHELSEAEVAAWGASEDGAG